MNARIPWLRLFIIFVALFAGLGGFIADFSETHILNPLWPPHAKFHNGQTMSMGMLLAVATMVFAFLPTSDTKLRLIGTALLGTLYWTSIVCAQFFPGVAYFDPQFSEKEKIMILGHRLTQGDMGSILVVAVWAAVIIFLARTRRTT
jgi:cell division protein FtsW (lipid II flippase)